MQQRNGDVVNEDQISHLPEDLLVAILSLLRSTKYVVATSVLSKRRRSLWKIVPKLEFNYHINESEHETFSDNVDRLLRSHKAPILESLNLYFSLDSCDAIDIERWIRTAYARHLRKLELNVYSEKFGSERACFTFPRSLYNCETLETLILRSCILIDATSPVCLKSLRTLHLESVNYKDDASVLNLLSGCPNLENLVIHRWRHDVKIFSIAVPSLQRLTIVDYEDGDDIAGYVINAPSLKYLNIQRIKGLSFRLIEIASELEEAYIFNVRITTIDEKLLRSLTSVKRLSLNLSPSEISTREAEWWNLLLLMFNCSPKLQVLELFGDNNCFTEFMSGEKWNQLENVSEWLHLETFVWKSYIKQLKKEKEIVKYILRNANHLKRATFSLKRDFDSDERHELLEELESAARDSKSSCEILFP